MDLSQDYRMSEFYTQTNVQMSHYPLALSVPDRCKDDARSTNLNYQVSKSSARFKNINAVKCEVRSGAYVTRHSADSAKRRQCKYSVSVRNVRNVNYSSANSVRNKTFTIMLEMRFLAPNQIFQSLLHRCSKVLISVLNPWPSQTLHHFLTLFKEEARI
jgi:hypothetical protein